MPSLGQTSSYTTTTTESLPSGLHKRMSISTNMEEGSEKRRPSSSSSSFIDVKRTPSAAFLKSMQMAGREEDRYPDDKEMLLPNQTKRIGLKTLIAAILFVVVGLLTCLRVSVNIVLLPGCYAATIIYGYCKQWRGYDLDQLPSYD
eukprot:scaffold1945_cov181-Ochromonas_danica.AAC.28